MLYALETRRVARTLLQRVYDPHAGQSVVTQWTVDARDPVVREPAGEDARVVEPEHVHVRPMHEVVR